MPKPKPVFRPSLKPSVPKPPTDPAPITEPADDTPAAVMPLPTADSSVPKPRTPFRPTQKPAGPKPPTSQNSAGGSLLHPLTDPAPDEAEQIAMAGIPDEAKVTEPMTNTEMETVDEPAPPKKPAAFRPTMKPPAKSAALESAEPTEAEIPKVASPTPKPTFRPTMKPKGPARPDETEDKPSI